MVCVKCGSENPAGAKYCGSCNAMLFQAAPTGLPNASTLDLEEMVDYPVPETHYQSPILQHLAWSVHEFIEEEGDLEPVLEAYEAFREVFEGFRSEIPGLKDYQYREQGKWEDDPIPSQIKYLISKAEEFYAEGEAGFEKYFEQLDAFDEAQAALDEEEFDDEDVGEEEGEEIEEGEAPEDSEDEGALEEAEFPDPEPIIEATKKWLYCNDNICLVFEFLVGRARAFNEMADELAAELENVEVVSEEEFHAEEAGETPAPEPEPEVEHVAPADSSDLA